MTCKELREIARDVLAQQLKSSAFNPEITNAALQTLHAPVDPDEERAAHRAHIESLNALSMRQANATNRAGTLMPPMMGMDMSSDQKRQW